MWRSCPLLMTLLSISLLIVVMPVRADEASQRLAGDIAPWVQCLSGRQTEFSLRGKVIPTIEGKPQEIILNLSQYDDESFDLEITHADYAVHFRRCAEGIAMALPKHHIVFLGKGEVAEPDHLQPQGIVGRVIGPGTSLHTILPFVETADASTLAIVLLGFTKLQFDADAESWVLKDSKFSFSDEGRNLTGRVDDVSINLRLDNKAPPQVALDDWPNFKLQSIPRDELERQFCRGLRRALEVLSPADWLVIPKQNDQTVAHGQRRWIDGNRVVLLSGTPEQIGKAHGELLQAEANRCVDSVVHMFGTVQTIITGRWFREDLESAYLRLAPHIPERHKIETRALAKSLGLNERLIETTNVFPELFHCSGFAVFGVATVDGKLYHGRVLDYMTTIGLQDSATTFIVAPEDQIPFANVGYAGFIGSVSGMNAEKISLGEMGGRGEGKWDGVPMATLMRRALEECSSLDEVKQLWTESPRTCEYYYVFADGEDRTAVGVAATPESIEFVEPGEGHELLGEGIKDAVVLSAGSRLEELRKRVKEQYGKIDVAVAQSLMERPVAMASNLHNVLFVPEDGVLYVANADHHRPAAERPYSKLDLDELVVSAKQLSTDAQPITVHTRFKTRDSLAPRPDNNADAAICLDGLCWQPEAFEVRFETSNLFHGDWLVRFPSPVSTGNATNDVVAMEWYQVRDGKGDLLHAPAMVVVHESGSGMTVGRLIAAGLRQMGIHSFLIQLPHYGARRGPEGKPTGQQLVLAVKQGIADVRRAKDAIAALPAVDSKRVSIQGTSLGGFVAATSASLDGAFDQVFILLAGGDLHGVMVNGKRDAAKMLQQFKNAGIDEEQLKAMLASVEPLRVAHRLDASKTWLFSGSEDDVVPIENALRLANTIGLGPHHIILPVDHYSGITYLTTILHQIHEAVMRSAQD